MENRQIKKCSLCNQELNTENLGLMLRGRLICSKCEGRLVNLKVTDREYPWYIEKIKNILIS